MLKVIKQTRERQEFEAVKCIVRDSFNDFFVLMGFAALISLWVLTACIMRDSITFVAAVLVVMTGFFFALYFLGEFKVIYPRRFRILYKRKKE
ncbi:MAG: hypothetical protein U9Q97_06675 [Acidobacteriota bacterium]|nr:hypothetical protein [Acidobacteriota bacterium]